MARSVIERLLASGIDGRLSLPNHITSIAKGIRLVADRRDPANVSADNTSNGAHPLAGPCSSSLSSSDTTGSPRAHRIYEIIACLIGLALFTVFVTLDNDPDDENGDILFPYFFPIVLTGGYICFALAQLGIYFGVPPIFTFGHQIGKIVPPVCLSERPDALPCRIKGFMDWTLRYLHGRRGDEPRVLGEPSKRLVREITLLVGIFAFFWAVLPPLVRFGMSFESAEEKEMRRLRARVSELEARVLDLEGEFTPKKNHDSC